LIAAHATADVLIACAARWFLGLKEFWVFPFVAGGVECGQAVLLAQFLFLGTGRAGARALLAAAWFALVYLLAKPIVANVGGPGAASEVAAVLAVPCFLSALPALIHLAGGRRIRPRDTSTNQPEHATFQFPLRRLFALTLAAAIVLAIVRFGR